MMKVKKASNTDWASLTTNLLKAELKKRDLTYKDLSDRLGECGISIGEPAIRSQMNRKAFKAHFLIASLHVIGCKSIDLSHIET